MAGGNSVSASTIDRWTWEIIGLLAARAPRLDRALTKIKKDGGEVVLLDGTLIPTRRRSGAANRTNYNGKHKKHGLLFLALTDQAGNLIWISSARRGAASEITAETGAAVTCVMAAQRAGLDVTGRPSANVRAKLKRLEDRGWLRRTAAGTFAIAP